MTFEELADRISQYRAAGKRLEAASLEAEWQKKPALGTWCLALALAGHAIVRRLRNAALRWALALVVFVSCYATLRLALDAADSGLMSPAWAVWSPVVAVGTVALLASLLRTNRDEGAAV